MKIVHVCNYNLKYLGARSYGTPLKINNGFVRNGHEVFIFSDRDIARASNLFGARKLGVRACNDKLVQVCVNIEPDVLALCHADVILPDTLRKIRRLLPNIVMFQYNLDGLGAPGNRERLLGKADCVDFTFITTGGDILRSIAVSSPVGFMPNPVDPSIDTGRCHERDDQPTDVFFAGALSDWSDPQDLRALGPPAIRDRLPEVVCEFYGLNQYPDIWGVKFKAAMCRAKMGLNFSQRPTGSRPGDGGVLYLYSSDRIALYMGNGLLVITSTLFDLSDLYGPDSLVEVTGVDELLDRISYFKHHDDERRRMAACGYELVHREFNERLIAAYMVEAASGASFSHAYRWPTVAYRPK